MNRMVKNEHYDFFFNKFNSFLSEHGLKKTQERFTILRAVVELNDPFLIKTLLQYLTNNKYHVSKATIYNTILLMEKCEILEKVLIAGTLHYQLTGNVRNCFYLISEKDKTEIEIDDKITKSLISFVEKKYGVKISHCNLQFRIADKDLFGKKSYF